MQRYSVHHETGRHGRGAPLLDAAGRAVLHVAGAWAVTDDHGRTLLFASPDAGGAVQGALLSGITEGVLAATLGGTEATRADAGGSGGGVQAVKRARRPVRGVPTFSTLVAVVRRERVNPGGPGPFSVETHEAGLPPLRFAQQATAADLGGYQNGFPDPRFGVYDLLHLDGRPIARHWAAVDRQLQLTDSVFDVADEAAPLAETVMLCLARFLAAQG